MTSKEVDVESLVSKIEPRKSPRMLGSKVVVLTLLLFQNTGYTLLRRYSMATLREAYDPQMVLLMGEVFKLVFSAFAIRGERRKASEAVGSHLSSLALRSGKMLALALIYGAMNILSYVAIKRIDAGVFTVCAQLKILTTAAFSTTFLRRSISSVKWRALLQLVLGCILVTVPQLSNRSELQSKDHLLGLAAVLVEVTLSGFASVYFEKVVKASDDNMTVWDRNFQLALHSIAIYILYHALLPADNNLVGNNNNPFHDFSNVAWALALLSGGGGLLVALTVKIADSVVKTLAISAAIVTSTLASHFLLEGPLTLIIATGAAIVALAVLNYAFDPTPPSS